MDEEERALTALCDQLLALRAECGHSAARRELLARIEDEARDRRPILGLLAQLLGTDPAAVSRQIVTLPGLGPGHANEEQFGCPDGACRRTATTTPAGPIPRCALTSRYMIHRAAR